MSLIQSARSHASNTERTSANADPYSSAYLSSQIAR
jgi:hypothetical protein